MDVEKIQANDILPFEIWMLIFGYITELNDVYQLLVTCKTFNQTILSSIKTISRNKCFNVEEIKKFPSLRIVQRPIIIYGNIDLEYISKRKFINVTIVIKGILGGLTDICNFIGQNEQMNFFSIIHNSIIYTLYDNFLMLGRTHLPVINMLNKLNNPNIKSISFTTYNAYINALDANKYILKLYFNNIQEIDFIKKPFMLDITCIHRFEVPCYLPHKIYCNYFAYNIIKFEILFENLKHNFPNANIDNVFYNRTRYLKECVETIEHCKKYGHDYDDLQRDYENELERDSSNKTYKII